MRATGEPYETRTYLWNRAGHHPGSHPLEEGQAAGTLMRGRPLLGFATAIVVAGLLLPAREPAYGQQPSTVIVTVVDSGARYPLANADIVDLTTGQHRLTDENGEARLTWPNDGQLRLRVRQVGYQPRQRTLLRADTPNGAATFAMSRVAYVISPVKAISRCSTSADSMRLDLSMSALDQLRQGAEKYDQFRQHYPFEASIERRTGALPLEGDIKRIIVKKETYRSESWERRYKPGDNIQYYRGGFTVPLLFLSTLGDSVFWEHHCFLAGAVESYRDMRAPSISTRPRATSSVSIFMSSTCVTATGRENWMAT